MRLLLLVAGLLVALPLAAEARMHAPYRGHRIVASGAAPLDTFTAPAAAYSFRKLKTAYAGPAIRLRRASDNAEADINFLSFTGFTGAPIDTAAANAHCAATTCSVAKWYDQSGNGRDVVQAAAANQPAYVANCNGSLPCARGSTTGQVLATAGSFTPATGNGTFSAVGRRLSGTEYCHMMRASGLPTTLGINASPHWLVGGSPQMFVAATTDVWHAVTGVVSGASSVLAIDGAETVGNAVGGVTAGPFRVVEPQGTSLACDLSEAVHWDNYALPAGERAALTANQRNFWSTP